MSSRPLHPLLSLLWNLVLLLLLYFLCRVIYVAEFRDIYSVSWQGLDKWQLMWGGLRFDTAAICYTNIPYLLLALLPLSPKVRGSSGWRVATKSLFVAINVIALWTNLFDTVYSRYTGRRTTSSFFSEFADEGNLGNIFFTELINHWYLVLIGIGFLAALLLLYRTPSPQYSPHIKSHRLQGILCTLACLFMTVAGFRGGLSYHRPLSLADANGYVNQAKEANIVLNTPFSLIRTIGKTTFTDPRYFPDDQLDHLFSPIHLPEDSTPPTQPPTLASQPNVIVLILESFGEEFWGFFNQGKGYTPFLDSLAGESLTFRHSYANGRKSIDALPSILSSIPMFVEPFILTRYANNEVSSIASCLRSQGYRTAFFHGADNASMGFRSYALSTGFQDYYGMDEYCADPRFHGKEDFDGYWAIWDEPFLQYFALMLDTLPQPFFTTLFTATSHHPFNIPHTYLDTFQGGAMPIYRTIQYTDHALRQFFKAASRMPWYNNTLFVITADHTNTGEMAQYKTDLGLFRVPILLFDPSHRLPRGTSPAIMQQIDIMPTLLGILRYPHPYLAFGADILDTPPCDTWAVSYTNGIYQYVTGDTLLLFDGQKVVGCYHLSSDPLLRHNLLTPGTPPPDCRQLQALIQSYMHRMINNQLTTPRENVLIR